MPMAAVIPAVASIGSAAIGAIGQKGAVAKGGAASDAAYKQARNDLLPWETTGTAANTAGADLLGLHGQGAADAAFGNFQTSPGYQFSFDEGMRGIDAGAASKGMLRSGATLKAEQAFGTGLADQEFQNYYKNLMGLSDSGLKAAGAVAGMANGQSASVLGNANAESSIYGNTGKGLGAGINDLFANPAVQKSIGGLFSGGSGGGYAGGNAYDLYGLGT